jgi:predicted nuclease of predicted toxin-antitoxin system
MILADENIHSFIIQALRDNNIIVKSVQEISPGITDEDVIRWATDEGLIILTEDKDFGEWVFAHHLKGLSILFLRYSFKDYKMMAETIIKFLDTRKIEKHVFITLTINKIRIRKL